MGMFDYLQCDHPLPDGRLVEGPVFQTKDFDCAMSLVVITAEGRIRLQEVHREVVPESERPYYGTPKWDADGIWRLAGSLQMVVDREYDSEFHGDMHFIGPEPDFRRYQARFTEGQLQWIKDVSVPAEGDR